MNRNLIALFVLFFSISLRAQGFDASVANTPFNHAQTFSLESFRTLVGEVFREVNRRDLEATELNQLFYLPTPELFNEVKPDGLGCAHCQVQTSLRGLTTQKLFEAGLATPPRAMARADLDSLWRQMEDRETLVLIIPGIFGEFIDKLAMNEVFEGSSLFADEWRGKFRAETGDRPCSEMSVLSQERFCDERNILRLVDWEKNPAGKGLVRLDELFKLGSWDVGGRSRIRVALFNLEGFSLESLGDESDRASIFNRRLEKFFGTLGRVPENILFVGYSRGTAFGLEMLSQAYAGGRPWVSHVKGFVSLGGVVFGSSLADEGLKNSESKVYRQLVAVDEVVQKMKLIDPEQSWMERLKVVSVNTKALWEFVVKIISIEGVKVDGNPFAGFKNGIVVDGFSLFSLTKKLFERFGLLNYGLSIRSYNSDVLRFQTFFRSAVVGVRQLSTDHRMSWWKSARLPDFLRLYSVVALMDSPESPLVNNTLGFQPESMDDQLLRKNWQQYSGIKISPIYEGSPLNDSQVSLAKAHFWPQVIRELNPGLANLKSQPLALVGTHHWGLALPIVNPTMKVSRDGKAMAAEYLTNPFPRKVLLFSLATALNWDLRAQSEAAVH